MRVALAILLEPKPTTPDLNYEVIKVKNPFASYITLVNETKYVFGVDCNGRNIVDPHEPSMSLQGNYESEAENAAAVGWARGNEALLQVRLLQQGLPQGPLDCQGDREEVCVVW